MLKVFRQQGVTSAIYGLIIVATVVVFVVQFRPGAQGATGSIHQECVAQVRGRCIDPKEFTAELMLVAPGRMIEASQVKALGIRKYVQEGLIERTLLVQDAERSASRSPKKSSTRSSSRDARTFHCRSSKRAC
jgi:hypothetical protein